MFRMQRSGYLANFAWKRPKRITLNWVDEFQRVLEAISGARLENYLFLLLEGKVQGTYRISHENIQNESVWIG